MEEEGKRKPRAKVSFQLTKASGNGTWYTRCVEDYSTVSEVLFKTEMTSDEKLIRIIKYSRQKLVRN